jgi:hypothetical protein
MVRIVDGQIIKDDVEAPVATAVTAAAAPAAEMGGRVQDICTSYGYIDIFGLHVPKVGAGVGALLFFLFFGPIGLFFLAVGAFGYNK